MDGRKRAACSRPPQLSLSTEVLVSSSAREQKATFMDRMFAGKHNEDAAQAQAWILSAGKVAPVGFYHVQADA